MSEPAESPARPVVAWRDRWGTLLLAAFLLVAVAVAALEVLGVARAFARAREAALHGQAETAASLALATDLFVSRYLALAETAARAVAGMDLDRAARRSLLESIHAANPEVGALFLTDAAGRVIEGAGEAPPRLDLSDHGYFRALVAGATSAVSDVVISNRTARPGVEVAARLRRPDGAFAGSLVFGLPTDRLATALALGLSGDAAVVIVDRIGRVVVHGAAPELPWEARNYSGLPLVARALDGRPSRASGFHDPGMGGGARLGAMAPVPRLGWAAGVFRPLDAALAPARRERALALLQVAGVVALGVGLALLLSRWLGAPVAALSSGVAALARGDLAYRVQVQGRHELARLADGFNAMAAELARARQAERELNEELIVANEELQANTAQLEENLGELEAVNQSLDEALSQVEAERRRLATTLDSLPDAVVVVDATETVVVANDGARRLFGDRYRPGLALAAPDAPEPAHWRDDAPVPPEDLPLRRALRTGEASVDLKLAVDAPDAGRRYVMTTAVPVTGRDGQRLGAVTVMRDVTEQQTVETLKDQFIARASHELRTPLTAIRGTLRFLRRALEGTSRESPNELVAMAERNVEQMVRLIDDLLDASQLQTGRLTLATEPLLVEDVLERVAGTLGPAAREKGVALQVEAHPGLRVVADPLKLEQVVTNLVANAVKFTPEGGTVAIAGRRLGAEVELRVHDTGPGLAPEHLSRVFEPFYQVGGGGRPDRSRGAGLGLTIAKGLVDLHGGRIWVESEGLGRGCTFVVRLPGLGVEGRAAWQSYASGSVPQAE